MRWPLRRRKQSAAGLFRDEAPASLALARWPLSDPALIYADQVQPGMVIHHPHGCSGAGSGPDSGALDVIAVAGPGADGMVYLASIHEVVPLAADWPCEIFTQADADLEAFVLFACQEDAASG